MVKIGGVLVSGSNSVNGGSGGSPPGWECSVCTEVKSLFGTAENVSPEHCSCIHPKSSTGAEERSACLHAATVPHGPSEQRVIAEGEAVISSRGNLVSKLKQSTKIS